MQFRKFLRKGCEPGERESTIARSGLPNPLRMCEYDLGISIQVVESRWSRTQEGFDN